MRNNNQPRYLGPRNRAATLVAAGRYVRNEQREPAGFTVNPVVNDLKRRNNALRIELANVIEEKRLADKRAYDAYVNKLEMDSRRFQQRPRQRPAGLNRERNKSNSLNSPSKSSAPRSQSQPNLNTANNLEAAQESSP